MSVLFVQTMKALLCLWYDASIRYTIISITAALWRGANSRNHVQMCEKIEQYEFRYRIRYRRCLFFINFVLIVNIELSNEFIYIFNTKIPH